MAMQRGPPWAPGNGCAHGVGRRDALAGVAEGGLSARALRARSTAHLQRTPVAQRRTERFVPRLAVAPR